MLIGCVCVCTRVCVSWKGLGGAVAEKQKIMKKSEGDENNREEWNVFRLALNI